MYSHKCTEWRLQVHHFFISPPPIGCQNDKQLEPRTKQWLGVDLVASPCYLRFLLWFGEALTPLVSGQGHEEDSCCESRIIYTLFMEGGNLSIKTLCKCKLVGATVAIAIASVCVLFFFPRSAVCFAPCHCRSFWLRSQYALGFEHVKLTADRFHLTGSTEHNGDGYSSFRDSWIHDCSRGQCLNTQTFQGTSPPVYQLNLKYDATSNFQSVCYSQPRAWWKKHCF